MREEEINIKRIQVKSSKIENDLHFFFLFIKQSLQKSFQAFKTNSLQSFRNKNVL